MNLYDNILSFKGTWRRYQERVLNFSDAYLSDKKIHIVAAPGAGKTTLGIELIRRTQKPCLILSPRIVIREQWLERIKDGFLNERLSPEDILSNDMKNPKLITSITYQTLFCGMTRYAGMTEEEETENQEAMDFSHFELLRTVKEAGIKVICLDECHHLKNEWWKALEDFMKEMGEVTVISLTATPPYTYRHLMEINEDMKLRAYMREELKAQWQQAVHIQGNMEAVETCKMEKKTLNPSASFFNALGMIALSVAIRVSQGMIRGAFRRSYGQQGITDFIFTVAAAGIFLWGVWRLVHFSSPLKRLREMAEGMKAALVESQNITSSCKISVCGKRCGLSGVFKRRNDKRERIVCSVYGRIFGSSG